MKAQAIQDSSLLNAPIELADPDPNWPGAFSQEARTIKDIGGNSIQTIEHIGSTAIPHMPAKPILDIMIGVSGMAEADNLTHKLQNADYLYIPEYERELPERRFLIKQTQGKRAAHLHVVQSDSEFWTSHLLFRDYLCSNPLVAKAYADLKRDLAQNHGQDREEYTNRKQPFIEAILKEARLMKRFER